MSELNPEHVEWCHRMFALLREGGMWGVPRSGLIFRKQDGKLVLTERMPYDPMMPISLPHLREQQDSDFDGIREHFGAAGIEVVEE